MEYVQAQFSLKFEPQIRIRRNVNQIEDFLEEYYSAPQTMPIPDDFAAEAPRIVLNSKNGHSQISFSQISVDLTVNFDGEYRADFGLTKAYMLQRLNMLRDLLKKIDITAFYFVGISYNVHLNTGNKTPTEYMAKLLNAESMDIYEASQRIAMVEDKTFFVNEQIGTFKEYQGKGIGIPNLLDFKNNKLVSEGVNLVLDVNNRYEYLLNGDSKPFDDYEGLITKIYELIEHNLAKRS